MTVVSFQFILQAEIKNWPITALKLSITSHKIEWLLFVWIVESLLFIVQSSIAIDGPHIQLMTFYYLGIDWNIWPHEL